MPDAVLGTTRELASGAFKDLRAVVAGLPADARDWRPAGPETNSIAVLATHSMNSTRLWLTVAAGLPRPPRDRDAEFRATGSDPTTLLDLIDALATECGVALDAAAGTDWGSPREWTRGDGEVIRLTAAYAVMHAVEHLRGHVDQASLTRHLWEASHER